MSTNESTKNFLERLIRLTEERKIIWTKDWTLRAKTHFQDPVGEKRVRVLLSSQKNNGAKGPDAFLMITLNGHNRQFFEDEWSKQKDLQKIFQELDSAVCNFFQRTRERQNFREVQRE